VEISAWRMTIPPGYRFEATQALRQVLVRAVVRRLLDGNPARIRSSARSPPSAAPDTGLPLLSIVFSCASGVRRQRVPDVVVTSPVSVAV
jgi:hypothetical protein